MSSILDEFDTDSLFINVGGFLNDQLDEKWKVLSDEKKVFYIQKLSRVIEDYVNERCYKEVQRKLYNSPIDDFRINWKQEVIAKSALFTAKKRYSMWHVLEEGAPVDRIKNVGLEIVRSDTPLTIKPRLKEMVNMILHGASDGEIKNTILRHKKEMMNVFPEEIAVNTGISDTEKYIDSNGRALKGAPWHAKGVINYRKLLEHLHIKNKYEDIMSGTKTKVVYVKKNSLGIESVSFIRWPEEFNEILQIDYQKHIDKFYNEKIQMLLEPMGKTDLINDNKTDMDLFFS